MIWVKIAIDIVHMLLCQKKQYFIAAQEGFSRWVKIQVLSKANTIHVAQF